MVPDGNQQNALADLLAGRAAHLLVLCKLGRRTLLCETARQECRQYQCGHGRRPDPPVEYSALAACTESSLYTPPHRRAVFRAALRNWRGVHCVEHLLQRAEIGPAGVAT